MIDRIQTQKELPYIVLLNTEKAQYPGTFIRRADKSCSLRKETHLLSQPDKRKQNVNARGGVFLQIEKRRT